MHGMRLRAPFRASATQSNDLSTLRRMTQRHCVHSSARRRALLIRRKASASPRVYQDESITADQLMSMQSNIIPSGRPRNGHRAGTAVLAASAGLGILALLGMNPAVLALVALGVLGSLLIATDRSIKHEPVVMLV
jgi:hypothetical protein